MGATADKCGKGAITEETPHFPVILRLSMFDLKMMDNSCTSKAKHDIEEQESKHTGRPSWMSAQLSPEESPVDLAELDDCAIKEKKRAVWAAFLQSSKCTDSFPMYTQFEFTM